jgi:hypothetical protein
MCQLRSISWKSRWKARPREPRRGEYPVDVLLDETFPALDRLKGVVDLAENEKVGCGDGEKEERRNAGADNAGDILESDVAIRRRSGGERDQDRKHGDHCRVAEREEEAYGDRPLAVLHQLLRDIVDRHNVVGAEGMAEAEAVGEARCAEQHRRITEGDQRPSPRRDVAGNEQPIDRRDPGPDAVSAVVEDG